MRKLYVCAAMIVVFVLAMSLAGCPKKAETPDESPPTNIPPPPTDDTATPADEPTDDAADDATDEATGTDNAAATGPTITSDVLDDWLATVSDEKVKTILDGMEDQASPDEGMESFAQAFDKAAENTELADAVKKHGFDNACDWADVTKKVFSGMMAAEALKEVGDDPSAAAFITPMVEALQEALGKPTEEEQKLIGERLPEIEAALETGA